ncbi:MAG: hypothetical protein P1U42_11945 [Phycisphaerales bacterium]|nr:hypothetical protein [Phycisphaerales bacterium]
MNKVMGFLKSNLVIVIFVVLILAFLPAGYIFSGKWNTKVHEKAKAAYTKEKRSLTSKSSINYSLPAVLEGEEDLSESRAPNNSVTKFYEAGKAEREAQVNDVVERGTAFNQGDHVELIPGILPKAENNRTLTRLGRDMAEAVVGTEARPSVYQRKLQRLNAGSPPDAMTLEDTLNEYKNREQQRYENSNADGKMSTAQVEQLQKDLIARRLGEYIARANALTFYCTTDAIVAQKAASKSDDRALDFSNVPDTMPPLSTIDESMVMTWLWDYWIISDVLDAVGLANMDRETGALAVPNAPIKRVESMRVSELVIGEGSSDDDLTSTGSSRPRSRSGSTTPASSSKKDDGFTSFTGRKSGDPQSAFDLRMIEIVVVASSQDLPRFIDAIGKTNYMTVTDLDIQDVDVWNDLEQGFYYGDDHTVRATMMIETVWLRSWMAPLMPDPIKVGLGIPVENASDDLDD